LSPQQMSAARMSFLITDDSLEIRQLIKAILADMSAAVYEAADGEESLAAYRAHRPDWVLMDLMMPGVGGLAATARMRKEHPAARIIIVTQQDSAAFRAAARDAGAIGYVLKENLLEIRELIEATANREAWS
jgi:CheY-like chemotaxis protein